MHSPRWGIGDGQVFHVVSISYGARRFVLSFYPLLENISQFVSCAAAQFVKLALYLLDLFYARIL